MGWIRSSFLKIGEVITATLGLDVTNKTGSTIAAGSLVYVSGWDTTTRRWKISKADADVVGARAVWIVPIALTNNSSTRVLKAFELQNANTSGLTVGDKVYLSATAGGWTATDPSTSSTTARRQTVGRVAVVSASVGRVMFDLAAHEDELPAASDLGVILANSLAVPVVNKTGGTLGAGKLVYINEWDAATARFTVAKADANAIGTFPLLVLRADLLNDGVALAYKTHDITGINTSAATNEGDLIFLSATAGSFDFTTAPAGADANAIPIGRVTAKDAVVGSVRIDLINFAALQSLGNGALQAGILSADATGRALAASSWLVAEKVSAYHGPEQTGNGAPQAWAHGLGRTPAAVFVIPSGTGAAAAFSYTKDGTNVSVTATNLAKYIVYAF